MSVRDVMKSETYDLPGAATVNESPPEERSAYFWFGAMASSAPSKPARQYAGMNVKQLAVAAQLERFYDILYRALSQPTHSTPLNEYRTHPAMLAGSVFPLLLYPSNDSLAAFPFLLSMCSGLGSLTCLAAAVVLYRLPKPTLDSAIRHAGRVSVADFAQAWAPEIALIYQLHAHPLH